MASSKTTIVIAPGLCHTPELYVGLRDKLEAKGFPTASAVPPSIFAEDASTIVVDTDTKFYQDHVIKPLLDEGKDVIVVGHSYGGAFGAAAVQGLSKSERAQTGAQGGVVGFIYAASFCVWPGESAVDALALDPSNLPAWVGPGSKPGTTMFTDTSYLWPNLSDSEAEMWLGKLKPAATMAIATPVSYAPFQDPYYAGRVAMIHLENDRIISEELHRGFLERSGIKLNATVPGPHGIGVEANQEVADAIEDLIEKMT